MKRFCLSTLVVLVLTSAADDAHAQRRRHGTTHALFVGGRFEPGAAWLAGYDLEVELGTPCGFNLGPSLSVAFGGEDGGPNRQDLLASLDLLRGRFVLDQDDCGSCSYRLQALLGAGAYFVMNPLFDAAVQGLDANQSPVTFTVRSPEAWRLGAQVTGGLSADWFFEDDLGITAILAVHVRLDDDGRMPALWAEAGLGLRFGT